MVGERKRKTPEGLSAVDTPPPSLSSALSPTLSHGAPLTKETCSLPAAARALATRRRDALLTILGQDSAPPSRALSLSLCISSYVDGMLPRPGRSSGLYFATRGFCGLSGKGQPPLCFCLSRPSCRPVACSHVATLGQGELPVRRLDELETLASRSFFQRTS